MYLSHCQWPSLTVSTSITGSTGVSVIGGASRQEWTHWVISTFSTVLLGTVKRETRCACHGADLATMALWEKSPVTLQGVRTHLEWDVHVQSLEEEHAVRRIVIGLKWKNLARDLESASTPKNYQWLISANPTKIIFVLHRTGCSALDKNFRLRCMLKVLFKLCFLMHILLVYLVLLKEFGMAPSVKINITFIWQKHSHHNDSYWDLSCHLRL